MVANRYKVPVQTWDKWNARSKSVFNDVFATMLDNKRLFLHPKQEPPRKAHWHTTAWNAAWLAAQFAADYDRKARARLIGMTI